MIHTLTEVFALLGVAAVALIVIVIWCNHGMEHKGVSYQVVQMADPTGYKWTVDLGGGRTRIGQTFSRAHAIFLATAAIDKALATLAK
jgi:hypothetical protein